jgi:hypothetical protein
LIVVLLSDVRQELAKSDLTEGSLSFKSILSHFSKCHGGQERIEINKIALDWDESFNFLFVLGQVHNFLDGAFADI